MSVSIDRLLSLNGETVASSSLSLPDVAAALHGGLPPRLSATVAWWIVGLNTGSKPVLDARSRDFLAERLAGDAAHLGRILGRPLPWPT